MLEGIHILNQTMIMDFPDGTGRKMLMFLGLLILSVILSGCTKNDAVKIVMYVIGIIAAIGFLYFGYFQKKIPTDRYKYEVTIDESVRFTDIYEKYEVIEQRGEIWVLEDKDD